MELISVFLKRILDIIRWLIKSIFGSKYEKDLEAIKPYLNKIHEEYSQLQNISNDHLRAESDKLREYLKNELAPLKQELAELLNASSNNNSIDKNFVEELEVKIKKKRKEIKEKREELLLNILPKAFAIMKETARRFKENESLAVTATPFDEYLSSMRDYVSMESKTKAVWKNSWDVMGSVKVWDMVHFDEQLIGGIVLHQGKIAEMATGEGKTLVSTLPIFLNALTGEGVHIVTVNEYLSKRDYMWNRPLFEFHGLTVGCIIETKSGSRERKKAYSADITYGTDSEFGFDYLRDNMVIDENNIVQRGHMYAIIDEIDSILIDDARTPLIISDTIDNDNTQDYLTLQPFVEALVNEQKTIINKCLLQVKENFKNNIKDEATRLLLYRSYRGYPKYKPLVKFLSEPGNKIELNKAESVYLENNCERMPEVDADLLFTIDEKNHNVDLTDKGLDFISQRYGNPDFFLLPDIIKEIQVINDNTEIENEEKEIRKKKLFDDFEVKYKRIHVVHQLLKAYTLFEKDVDYVVSNGNVYIISEQTGRPLEGHRYSDGLHQAIEAKERVKVRKASQTYATITLQNYFRMYEKLAGMTGTAITEAAEFLDIYKLDIVTIPTHKKMIREDFSNVIYKTIKVKFNAIIDKVAELSAAGRPVLVGTASVETSELLSRMLKIRGIKHQVLNAKYHEQEAEIISHAGEHGTVTIATNMAGRGTDIKLDEEARKAGGLAIIGSEKHESRRIDRQLRGRSGRQGDAGSSQFFVSFEDNLMRMTLGNDNVQRFIDRLDEDEVLDGMLVTSAIERAQRKIEEANSASRRFLLKYDDVLSVQRKKIYSLRNKALKKEILLPHVSNIINQVIQYSLIAERDNARYEDVNEKYHDLTGDEFFESKEDFENDLYEDIFDKMHDNLLKLYTQKGIELYKTLFPNGEDNDNISTVSDNIFSLTLEINLADRNLKTEEEKGLYILSHLVSQLFVVLIDKYWKKHLQNMSKLRNAVQNAYYEQHDPLIIYKKEAYKTFMTLITELNTQVLSFVFKCKVMDNDSIKNESDNIEILQKEILEQMRKKLNALKL